MLQRAAGWLDCGMTRSKAEAPHELLLQMQYCLRVLAARLWLTRGILVVPGGGRPLSLHEMTVKEAPRHR